MNQNNIHILKPAKNLPVIRPRADYCLGRVHESVRPEGDLILPSDVYQYPHILIEDLGPSATAMGLKIGDRCILAPGAQANFNASDPRCLFHGSNVIATIELNETERPTEQPNQEPVVQSERPTAD